MAWSLAAKQPSGKALVSILFLRARAGEYRLRYSEPFVKGDGSFALEILPRTLLQSFRVELQRSRTLPRRRLGRSGTHESGARRTANTIRELKTLPARG